MGPAPSKVVGETVCQVCSKHFDTPKLLPCGHVMCRNCVLSLLTRDGHNTLCPFCRRSLVQPAASATDHWSSWVNELPTDVSMVIMVEKERVLHGQPMCCVCDDEHASTYCTTCGQLFCGACTRLHTKQRATRDHTVKTLAEVTADQLGNNSVLCEQHEKVFELLRGSFCMYEIQ